jgi:cell division protein FtsB
MLTGLYRFLGWRVPARRTTFKSVFNSVFVVTVFGAVLLFPNFMVYVDQANQLKEMDANIQAGFNNIDALVDEVKNVGDEQFLLSEAEKRLRMTPPVEPVINEQVMVASDVLEETE